MIYVFYYKLLIKLTVWVYNDHVYINLIYEFIN